MPRDEAALPPIFHRSFDGGAARVLALHCGLGQSGMWKAVAAELASLATLIAPDLPGHGRSGAFPEGRDVHDVATQALRPFLAPGMHLVGHSFGATVALRLALEAPEPPASLTLIEPVFFAAARGHPLHDSHRAQEQAFLDTFASGDMIEAARCFNHLWGGGMPRHSFPEKARQDMAARMPFVAATEPSLWQDSQAMLAPGRLEALNCPVALIRGAGTVPVIAAIHAGLASRLPRARDITIPGAGHMVPLTHPKDVAAAISGMAGFS
ncbi:alpha/beta fold hydrolase [Ponticoccus litoralis]|uniref:Alpha/beta hydrolase n=1 Tax=Ponticoccus litoralis TaxID=422297 RepID=A0AAW9SKD1_9RHOB